MLSGLQSTLKMTGYEASERFWARIIMHMLIMRIIPIIMLSLRLYNIIGSLLSCDAPIIVLPSGACQLLCCILYKTQKFCHTDALALSQFTWVKGTTHISGSVVNTQ